MIGAYLPWLSGTIGIVHFAPVGLRPGPRRSATRIGAIALAISALLSVRMRVFRWLTVVLSFVIAGFVVRDLLNSYDAMQTMNAARSVDANVGMGPLDHDRLGAIAMIALGPAQRGPENRLTWATLRCLPGAATHQGDAPAPEPDEDRPMSDTTTTQRYGTAAVAVARVRTPTSP